MVKDPKIIDFLEERLRAYEGGAPAVHIGYDDATRCYIISQKESSFFVNYKDKVLGCSTSLPRAFELAINGEIYEN